MDLAVLAVWRLSVRYQQVDHGSCNSQCMSQYIQCAILNVCLESNAIVVRIILCVNSVHVRRLLVVLIWLPLFG